jgi:transposase
MPQEKSAGKPTTRRYSMEEKQAAVRMVRALRAETGMTHGAVKRVAQQLGYGTESVRLWVRQADVDEGVAPGVTSNEAARVMDRRAISGHRPSRACPLGPRALRPRDRARR